MTEPSADRGAPSADHCRNCKRLRLSEYLTLTLKDHVPYCTETVECEEHRQAERKKYLDLIHDQQLSAGSGQRTEYVL